MPTETELRERFHDDDRSPGQASPAHEAIDLDAVLRRSRARRRPRVVGIVVVGSLAALAVVLPVSVNAVLGQAGTFSASSGSATSRNDTGATAPESTVGGSGAQKTNLCGGPLAALAPASNGLVLSVSPVEAAASSRDIPATVTLTNTGTTAFSGSASPFPTLTFSRQGIVLWHSNGAVPSLAQLIDLAPGASIRFATSFEPVVCGTPDEERPTFRTELPAAGPGRYGLSAVLEVSTTDGRSIVVSGPVATATLR